MISRARSLVLSSTLIFGLVAAPAWGSTQTATISGATGTHSCYAGVDGTCSATAAAGEDGSISAAVELHSPDSPLSRSTRYAMGLARHTIGFDLEAPTREAEITVSVVIKEARAEWQQDHAEVFGGTTNDNSGAKVLFQLLGHEAPSDCGCGWYQQGSPNVVPVRVTEPQRAHLHFNTLAELTMTATNPYGDKLLPAGHYEVLLRSYALADLFGAGDWGTLTASVDARIKDVTVSVGAQATNLTLSVAGTGSNRVLSAELTDSTSAPIDGRTISFYAEGVLLGTAVTDDGVATLPVDGKFRGGSRSFTAEFAGDDAYEASSAQATS